MKYAELTPHAQQRAVAWWCACEQSDWDGGIYVNGLVDMLAPLGITIYTRDDRVVTRGGSSRVVESPDVRWCGFYSHDNGFVFRGRWRAEDMDVAKLQDEYPQWEDLHALAARAIAFMLRQPEGAVEITTTHYGPGLPRIAVVSDDEDEADYCDMDLQADLDNWVEDVCQLCFDCLQEAYEGDTSEAAAVEAITANDYDFDEEGTPA